jgi:hypothetical protein
VRLNCDRHILPRMRGACRHRQAEARGC